MTTVPKPITVRVYQDVLCPWSHLAERRMEPLKREFGPLLRWIFRPYALRLTDAPPSHEEVNAHVEEVRRARAEHDGQALTPDLWLTSDPPRSSVTALAALEAARLQGSDARARLSQTLRVAALEQGINVTRHDVVLELAQQVGLSMNRFSAAFQSTHTERLIRQEHRLATQRGVDNVPTLIIAGRWMLTGLRETGEYRDHILRCLKNVPQPSRVDALLLIH